MSSRKSNKNYKVFLSIAILLFSFFSEPIFTNYFTVSQ
jgi:hypothetical protein